MSALDDALAGLGGGSVALALLVAVLLGLRHATDPDHLTAVATLIVSDAREGPGRARRLGLAWGLGHGLTLFAFGLPVVLVGDELPEPVQRAAELAIGIVIVGLAVRLLVRWRRGCFHTHPHVHEGLVHAHPHVHEAPHAAGAASGWRSRAAQLAGGLRRSSRGWGRRAWRSAPGTPSAPLGARPSEP